MINTGQGYEIHWRAEYSIGRYSTYRVDHFGHLRDGTEAYVREAWLTWGIDGIVIDVSA